MNFHIETPRLLLRELRPEDAEALFAMDSNPEVHRYLGDPILTHVDQASEIIARVEKQYQDFGIGRWAVVERSSGNTIGWSGLKFMDKPYCNKVGYHDVGYRFQPQYWGNGYATETTLASLEYAFATMGLATVCATTDMNNLASRRVLEKAGLRQLEVLDDNGYAVSWLEITKEEWEQYKHSVQVVLFENANVSDAELLSKIAMQSKQHWGYSDEQMKLWKNDLQLSEDYIAKHLVTKVYDASRLLGFYGVIQDGAMAEIDHLWLLPAELRKGYGRKIFGHLIDSIRAQGCTKAILTAEPHAAGFYNSMGGIHYNTTESKIAGRMLEQYEFIV